MTREAWDDLGPSLWPNFSYDEMSCKETGENGMDAAFMEALQRLRTRCDFPFVISSGYRSVNHSIEAAKERPGAHGFGKAVDIKIYGNKAMRLLSEVFPSSQSGIYGIGVAQSGPVGSRYIHLDGILHNDRFPRPFIWSY